MEAAARAIEHRYAAHWPDGDCAGTLTLDYDARHRRRIKLTSDTGETVLLDLPQAVAMADGDGLRLEDGRWLRIKAAPETLIEVRAASPQALTRIAWHIGNRHLPAEIRADAIFIHADHVIEAMLRGLGATLTMVEAPFQPENGAYGGHVAMAEQAHIHGPADKHHHHADGHGTTCA